MSKATTQAVPRLDKGSALSALRRIIRMPAIVAQEVTQHRAQRRGASDWRALLCNRNEN